MYKIPTTETANLVFVPNLLDNDLKVEVEWLKPIFVEFNVINHRTHAILYAILKLVIVHSLRFSMMWSIKIVQLLGKAVLS